MVSEVDSGKLFPVVTGAVFGVITFFSLLLWFGLPVIPTTKDLPSILRETPSPYPAMAATASAPATPGEATYQTVCAACHQANAQGLPGAFPPLAGSEWVNGDPETMIRIVLAGLSGPIEVKGTAFNQMMPPPPGLDDEKIAQVITHVRANFGNKASEVKKEQVTALRAEATSRGKPWTSAELKALQKPGDGAAAPAGEAPAQPAAAPK
ncbi:MAG TPA: cytochrome c [Polyangiales bacterium]|nr:cytochrome c [Polyangiales bacterium]